MKQKNFAVIVGVWLLIGCAGLVVMLHHEKLAGVSGNPPREWPLQSAIPHRGLTLVMFVHPRCPCTRASIGELAQVMARFRGKVTAQVLFVQPAGEGLDWVKGGLWRLAEAIPGVTVHADSNGVEARRFNAITSGQTMLYGENGLLFTGGITAGRGHAGDNPGRDAITALADGQIAGGARTAVYGCGLPEKSLSCERSAP
jgi:hypothetical protein